MDIMKIYVHIIELYKFQVARKSDKCITFEFEEERGMGELSKLPNIGKKVEEQLNQVGIN